MSKIAPTYDDFIAIYPEFTSIGQPIVENYLSLASRMIDVGAWGEFYSDAIGLDTAHSLAIKAMGGNKPTGGLQGAIGAISSVSAAGVNTSFATVTPDAKHKSDIWYMKTAYGLEFLSLRDRVIPMGVMAS